jgi:iron complex transport system ATP-binding protein
MKDSLTAKDLSHTYAGRPVLDGVSFSVREGEFFIIIGPNGSGKTTLAKAISGTLKPERGQIEVLGRPIRSYSGKKLARQVAMVPQTPPANIPFTVEEVVLMGRSPHLSLIAI